MKYEAKKSRFLKQWTLLNCHWELHKIVIQHVTLNDIADRGISMRHKTIYTLKLISIK